MALPPSAGAARVRLVDLDLDGARDDLAVADDGLDGMGGIWLADSDESPGGFAPPALFASSLRPIDVDAGDFDDDGVNDLLVGQFGGGVLWIYKNVGTNEAPKLAAGVKFQDGRKEGTVPTG